MWNSPLALEATRASMTSVPADAGVDGVLHPLAGGDVSNVVPDAGTGAAQARRRGRRWRLQCPRRRWCGSCRPRLAGVVVRDRRTPSPPVSKLSSMNVPGQRDRYPRKWGLGDGGFAELSPIQVARLRGGGAVDDHLHHVLPGREADAGRGDRAPRLPARRCFVKASEPVTLVAVEFDVEFAAADGRREADIDRVRAGAGGVDRVLRPFRRRRCGRCRSRRRRSSRSGPAAWTSVVFSMSTPVARAVAAPRGSPPWCRDRRRPSPPVSKLSEHDRGRARSAARPRYGAAAKSVRLSRASSTGRIASSVGSVVAARTGRYL